MEQKWVNRLNYQTEAEPVKPHWPVWRVRGGGFLIRGRAVDPRTKKLRQVAMVVHSVDPAAAYLHLQEELGRVRSGAERRPTSLPSFGAYATSLYERKIQTGRIRSAKGRAKWEYVLKHHLGPAFGALRIDQLSRLDIIDWQTRIGQIIAAGKLSPNSANTWWSILKVIVETAVADYDLERDPMKKLVPFDTSVHATYTDEEPNSLTFDELGPFLEKLKVVAPQHYAFAALGFYTGLRPSSLRPLRRRGPNADILWSEGVLLVRRSHTAGEEVMGRTKTGISQRLGLHPWLMGVLREHVERMPPGPMVGSDLLFPSETGGFRSPSCLDKPFAAVGAALELKKRVTPRGMRRTFQDLARAAQVADIVTRSISGHQTEAMQRRYSTVTEDEQRAGMGRMLDLVAYRGRRAQVDEKVDERGGEVDEKRKAGWGGTL